MNNPIVGTECIDTFHELALWAIHFIATPAHGDPPPEANGAGQGLEHSRGGSQMDSPPSFIVNAELH
jgi:hypothetical protein